MIVVVTVVDDADAVATISKTRKLFYTSLFLRENSCFCAFPYHQNQQRVDCKYAESFIPIIVQTRALFQLYHV